MAKRKVVQIDEERCDGCGQCVPACAEGAIQIIEGKARLVSDVYCDGLGACLGECPQGAITIVEREAEAFDEQAVQQHVRRLRANAAPASPPSGCPGMAVRSFPEAPAPTRRRSGDLAGSGAGSGDAGTASAAAPAAHSPESVPSALRNWPVQLQLVPPRAPFFKECDLLLVADCVPLAYADFHREFLRERPVVVGCPKLDDAQWYVEKLSAILAASSPKSLTVVHMEVPCCTGLVRIAEAAVKASGVNVPMEDVTISIRGEILERVRR
jgi:Pyruvate/2-oxoacid:ferredoxin oxidoreductase delta subunit